MARILVVDDDESFCKAVVTYLEERGYKATSASTLSHGLGLAHNADFDVVLLDVALPDGSGLDHIRTFKKVSSQPEVIIITGTDFLDGPRLAIEADAWDYLRKPISFQELELQLTRAMQYRQGRLYQPKTVALKWKGIVGESPVMSRCFDLVAQAASSESPVLITGESGTGKELFARAIHENSKRARGSFVVVDCGALPEQLIISILFGHRRGAFTGADRDHPGLLAQAHGGTLFLDEVGELSLITQRAFLRVLQEKRFRPVGSKEEMESDFRIIAATNRDLEAMVQEGTFRQDLFYRLKGIVIQIPPLRERKEDIKPLIIHYMGKLCDKYGMDLKGFSPEVLQLLEQYPWPGNVRELIHTLESVIARAANDPVIFPVHLPAPIRLKMLKDVTPAIEEPQANNREPFFWPRPLPPIKKARIIAKGAT
ncbi:MAG: sigma-54 dependent transcriptional regulator [Candidatus Hadarchaeales archaeon]